jgi:hypothetical protein
MKPQFASYLISILERAEKAERPLCIESTDAKWLANRFYEVISPCGFNIGITFPKGREDCLWLVKKAPRLEITEDGESQETTEPR